MKYSFHQKIYYWLKKVNFILIILLGIYGLYFITIGLLPEINLLIVKANDSTQGYVYKSYAASQQNISQENLKIPPIQNQLIIPKIYVNAIIWEGETEETLNSGIWRRPQSKTPDELGNMVLTGHRFQYTYGPNTFYHLDKLSVGDSFFIFWEGAEYNYRITEIKEVEPSEIYIESDTQDNRVTLYTCTPLYSAEKRLVVIGILQDKHEIIQQ